MDLELIKKTMVIQQDTSDCGVACLLSIIQYHGGENTLEQLRKLSGTTRQGTTLLGLYQAALQVGFNANGCESDILSLIGHGSPVILHLRIDDKYEHYAVCYGYTDERFVLSDPAKGLVFDTIEELEKKWVSHTCLTLFCTNKFVWKDVIKAQKKTWLLKLIREDYEILGISIILGLCIAILNMTTAVFSQKLIDVILPEKDYSRLWIGLFLVFVLLLVRLGLGALRQFFLFTQGRDFNNRIITLFYSRLLHLPRSFFDTRKIGELVARLNDTRRIQQVISTVAGNIIIDALITLVTVSFLFYYFWTIATLLSLSIPLFVYIIHRYNMPLIQAQRNVMVGYAQSESNFIHTMQGVDTVKNLNKQADFETLNRMVYGAFQGHVFSLGKLNIRISVVSGIISTVLLILSIGIGSYYVLHERILLGELMAIISLTASVVPAIVNLALVSIPINEAKVAFSRMFEFINIPTEKKDGEIISSPVTSINIENLSFRFPGRKNILNRISLSVSISEMVFLIGESGCGKSTLCKLLEKSYEPEFGCILLNNSMNIRNIDLNEWRKIIGVIPQEIFIFNGTVLENICMGTSNKTVQEVLTICTNLGIDKYILRFPQGYATIVGEEGINLSGGEKQLIALARLLTKEPQIMILDEPTSSMDKDMETFTLNLLNSIKKEKIIFFVSHRLHILKRYSDRIFLIENGEINYTGTHQEMLQSENIYSLYWNEFNSE